jgi:fibronectin type 3 domain-containing protein
LNPGQALSLNLQFAPTATGSASGQLTIASNSSTNPTATVALNGTGQAQTTYSVSLSWVAPDSSSDPVVGYNVYRAPTGSSSYALLNPSKVTPANYSDSTVTRGQTYDYVVKSVDAAGTESPSSNSATVSVP